MADQTHTELLAQLNDLLQLDHDAVQAYTIAIDNLRSDTLRSSVLAFRGDHERHIADLTLLVRSLGGTPIESPHIPSGFFKEAVQKVGTAGGDREILLAFKANEGQVRDKYRQAASRAFPPEVGAVVRRNAADEERHYAWVTQALEALGAGPRTAVGKAEEAFETVHGATADVMESAEEKVMMAASATRETVSDIGDRVGETVSAAGDRVRETVSDVGERVQEIPGRAAAAAGGGLESAARGLDRAADWAEEKGGVGARVAPPVRQVADTLEETGARLRAQDFDAIREDVEREVVGNPIRSVLIAAGIGYVVGRMIR